MDFNSAIILIPILVACLIVWPILWLAVICLALLHLTHWLCWRTEEFIYSRQRRRSGDE